MGFKETRRKICKWIYGHKQSGSNITTRGDYIITQYGGQLYSLLGIDDNDQGTSSTDPSKNWTWVLNASDGAHAFAMSNMYYAIDYKGYPDPVIKASGSTYYIDYGAVDMDYRNGHWQTNPDCTELPCPAGTANQGTYYNHTAASAGSSFLKKTADFPDEYVPDSICPKGWTLPTYREYSNKSFYNLIINAYGGIEVSSNRLNADVITLYPPLSFIRAGYYNYLDTKIYNSGTIGHFWGKRPNSNGEGASSLYINSYNTSNSLLQPKSNPARGQGNSIRCVSRS